MHQALSTEPRRSAFFSLLALGLIATCIGTLTVWRRKVKLARKLTAAIGEWENEGGSVATRAPVLAGTEGTATLVAPATAHPGRADGHDPSPPY